MQRTISSMWIKGLCDMFAMEGLDIDDLLCSCGIDRPALTAPEQRFPAELVTRLWELAVARAPHPNPGLKRELCDRYSGFRLMEFSLAGCASLLEGMQRLQRFMAILSEAASFSIDDTQDGFWLQLGLVGELRPQCQERIAFGMLSLLMQSGWLVRRDITPLAVEFAFPAPMAVEDFRTAFLCDVRFSQPGNRMLLSRGDMLTKLPTHNPVVSALHEQLLQQHLHQMGHTSMRYRVVSEIMRRLKQGEPRRADIAASLHVSDRTLQRRLTEEKVSYQQLLNEARKELAQQYLADSRLSLAEVADLLGFLDQSNFHRASKRWFGIAPGQYRASLDESGGPSRT